MTLPQGGSCEQERGLWGLDWRRSHVQSPQAGEGLDGGTQRVDAGARFSYPA